MCDGRSLLRSGRECTCASDLGHFRRASSLLISYVRDKVRPRSRAETDAQCATGGACCAPGGNAHALPIWVIFGGRPLYSFLTFGIRCGHAAGPKLTHNVRRAEPAALREEMHMRFRSGSFSAGVLFTHFLRSG